MRLTLKLLTQATSQSLINMGCIKTLSAYKRGCFAPGGAQELLIWNKKERVDKAISFTVAAKLVTFAGTISTPALQVYKLAPEQGNIFFTQPVTNTRESRAKSVTATLTVNLHELTAVLSELADNLQEGIFEGIVTLESGKRVVFGLQKGLQSNGGDAGFSGEDMDNGGGVTIILEEKAAKGAPFIENAAYDAFLALVTLNE